MVIRALEKHWTGPGLFLGCVGVHVCAYVQACYFTQGVGEGGRPRCRGPGQHWAERTQQLSHPCLMTLGHLVAGETPSPCHRMPHFKDLHGTLSRHSLSFLWKLLILGIFIFSLGSRGLLVLECKIIPIHISFSEALELLQN